MLGCRLWQHGLFFFLHMLEDLVHRVMDVGIKLDICRITGPQAHYELSEALMALSP